MVAVNELDDLTHDIIFGHFNGVAFTDWDAMLTIPQVPCPSCSAPIWDGICVSTCGATDIGAMEYVNTHVWRHECGNFDYPEHDDCPVCFPGPYREMMAEVSEPEKVLVPT